MADFSHVVYQSVSGSSLFTYTSIISMCTLETIHMKNQPQYTELCETKVININWYTICIIYYNFNKIQGPADCCPGWSLGGYVALLYNRTSCFTIQVWFVVKNHVNSFCQPGAWGLNIRWQKLRVAAQFPGRDILIVPYAAHVSTRNNKNKISCFISI